MRPLRPVEVPVAGDQPGPRDRSDDGDHRPGTQPVAPVAEGVGDRHGEPQRRGQADGERRRVDGRDQPDAVGEVQLDQGRQHHVGDRHPRQGQHRQRQERRLAVDKHASAETSDHADQREQRHAVQADPAGQGGRQGAEQRERQHRQARQQSRRCCAHAETGAHLGQHRAHADGGRTQVQGEEHQPDQHQDSTAGGHPAMFSGRPRGCCGGSSGGHGSSWGQNGQRARTHTEVE